MPSTRLFRDGRMTENRHNCSEHFRPRRATRKKPYHFLDSGLPNVYLVGVKYWTCRECGAQAAEIPAPEQLMDFIAEIIIMKPGLLTGPEIKFLRKRAGKKNSRFRSTHRRNAGAPFKARGRKITDNGTNGQANPLLGISALLNRPFFSRQS